MRIIDVSGKNGSWDFLSRKSGRPDPLVEQRVRQILADVEAEGDEAVTTWTRQLDCKFIDSLGLRVSGREVDAAYDAVSKEFIRALGIARKNINRFHSRQRQKSWTVNKNGMRLKQRFLPLQRVGMYVPGGKAAYPSTVLMNALPARIAGVKEIVMVTPCNQEGKISPEVLVAASECGIDEIYRIGGAQAIAALAFGTESIRRVDKITGPGNAYVAAAKQLVYGQVGIDVIAGPTEVVVVADATANPAYVAADLIAQAEHDETATPILITSSKAFAQRVKAEVERQLEGAPRRAVARRAFDSNGVALIVINMKQAVELVNGIAPEHLELMVKRPKSILPKIRNAGSIFVGARSTEAMGDYIAGPNHTLPTSGTARFSSPLGVQDFIKFTNIIEIEKKAFNRLAPHVEVLAQAEGLDGHAASVRIRRNA